MSKIRRQVLDILKPHEPRLTEFTKKINEQAGVESVNATLIENDEDVQNIKLTIQGDEIDEKMVKNAIEGFGASIHSVDQVVSGKKIIEDVNTPQDR